ncbi:hypothetical protein F2Q68_00003232 [Brassica cretica]|uniref:Uncharacterized protein n=1 Tax=Brassica cretica TaxID=69181 RepID=A0A8S9JPM5_BRACR|nr:hypothetical protein F2Q68_00003232 [Brassica cretica]
MADLSGDSRLGSRLVRLKRRQSWCLVVLMRAGGVKMRQLQLVHLFSTHGDGNCLNGIQSSKMKEVRNGMAKDVLFRFGLKGYKSDEKMKEQQDRGVTRSKR